MYRKKISPKYLLKEGPYDDYCQCCGAEEDITRLHSYHTVACDIFMCFDCFDCFYIGGVEAYIQKQAMAPYMDRLNELSKKRLYDLLQKYKYKNRNAKFIDDFDYIKWTKFGLLTVIYDSGILIDFSNYLDTLDQA